MQTVGRVDDVVSTSLVSEVSTPDTPLSPYLRLAHLYKGIPPATTRWTMVRQLEDFEFILVIQGHAWLWIESLGGAIRLEPHSLVLLPPYLVHGWGGGSETHIAVHFDLHAQPSLGPLDSLIELGRRAPLHATPANPVVRWAGLDGRLLPLVQPIIDLQSWRATLESLVTISAGRTSAGLTLAEQLAVQHYLTWAMRRWLTIEDDQSTPSASAKERLQRHLSQIDPSQRPSIDELARRLNMSKSSLRTTFMAVTGMPPSKWLEYRRMQSAAHMLRHTDRPIMTVASQCGYTDPYHFSRVFKRVLGCSPRDYRGHDREPTADIQPGHPPSADADNAYRK